MRKSVHRKQSAQEITPLNIDRISAKQQKQREEVEKEKQAREERINEQKGARQSRYEQYTQKREQIEQPKRSKRTKHIETENQVDDIQRTYDADDIQRRKDFCRAMISDSKAKTLKALKEFQNVKFETKKRDNDIHQLIQLSIPEALKNAAPEEVEHIKTFLNNEIKNIQQKLEEAKKQRKEQFNTGNGSKKGIKNYCDDIEKQIENLDVIKDYEYYGRLVTQSATTRVKHFKNRINTYQEYNKVQNKTLESLKKIEKELKIEKMVEYDYKQIEGMASSLRAELKNAGQPDSLVKPEEATEIEQKIQIIEKDLLPAKTIFVEQIQKIDEEQTISGFNKELYDKQKKAY